MGVSDQESKNILLRWIDDALYGMMSGLEWVTLLASLLHNSVYY
jgi:hypothetical protein